MGTNTKNDFEFWRGIPVFNFDNFGKNYFDNNFILGRSAVKINENLPRFIVKKLISK